MSTVCGAPSSNRALALCASLLLPAGAQASHEVFHVFTPVVEAGDWGAEALSAVRARRAESGDDTMRAAHELAVHGGITDFWMAKLAFTVARDDGAGYSLRGLALENVFAPMRGVESLLHIGWFTAVTAGIAPGETNVVELGPIFDLAAGRASLILNPFIEKTFGDNRESGFAFSYAWRATYTLSEQLSLGLEGYGEIAGLGTGAQAGQVHRIGPVLYLGHVHGARFMAPAARAHAIHGQNAAEHPEHGGEWHAEIGVLIGLPATPDAALKVNLGRDF